MYTHSRTVEQGIMALDLAAYTSNCLYRYSPQLFSEEFEKVIEYSLKAALLCKYQLNIQRELKYLQAAFNVLKKSVMKVSLEKQFLYLFRLVAIAVYIGDARNGKIFFDRIYKIYKEEFNNLSEKKKVEAKEIVELVRQVWTKREDIQFKKNRKINHYRLIEIY